MKKIKGKKAFTIVELVIVIAVIAILLLVSLLIISNTVKLALHERQDEIAIMKMVGATNGFENALFYVGRLLLSSLVASLGTVYIAAYSLANNLNNFGWTMLGAFTVTSMTVVGQCIGADETQ